MAADPWDPTQYERFAAERAQPFHDLTTLLDPLDGRGRRRVVDLGCGTGELTATLADRLQADEVLGLDNSAAMLERAAAHAGDRVRFAAADIGTWSSPGDVDVVVANASLQWMPDHAGVLARWTRALSPGGQLAVQVPANHDHPSHLVATEVAASDEFAAAFAAAPGGRAPTDVVAANVLTPVAYAELLETLGYERQHVRLQVYGHHLASTSDVAEWTKGTSLTRFKPYLPGERFGKFVEVYRRRLVAELGDQRPHFYPFKRILFAGRRPR